MKHLTLTTLLFVALTIGLLSPGIHCGPAPARLIQLSVAKPQYPTCEPIILHLIVKNSTAKTITFNEEGHKLPFDIQVTDSNGKPVPLTRYGAQRQAGDDASGGQPTKQITIAPGKDDDEVYLLNSWFDMTKTDKYTVTAAGTVSQNGVDIKVTSNTVKAEVKDMSGCL